MWSQRQLRKVCAACVDRKGVATDAGVPPVLPVRTLRFCRTDAGVEQVSEPWALSAPSSIACMGPSCVEFGPETPVLARSKLVLPECSCGRCRSSVSSRSATEQVPLRHRARCIRGGHARRLRRTETHPANATRSMSSSPAVIVARAAGPHAGVFSSLNYRHSGR